MQEKSDLDSSSARAESFVAALKNLHAVPYIAGDAKVTVDILKTIVSGSDARLVVAGGLPTPAKMLVEGGLKGTRHVYVEDLKPTEAVGVISKADVGISWASLGAARQGALVEIAYDDAIKLVSALPRISIFLLSSQTLLPGMEAVIANLGEIVRTAGERKPAISIISGPSKTADIELRLLYGVHGPHELHVILLDWI
jgi:L-lactate dehydrogenase complex protein LldG